MFYAQQMYPTFPFVYDKVYATTEGLQDNADEDGVLLGRYVMVNPNYNGQDITEHEEQMTEAPKYLLAGCSFYRKAYNSKINKYFYEFVIAFDGEIKPVWQTF